MKKRTSFDLIFSKYRILFFSITAFLILIGALLGLNLYSSLRVGEGTATINASAYMRDLNQAITRDLFNLRLSYGEDPNTPHMRATIQRLQRNLNLYDHNLQALEHGGNLTDADGDQVQISSNFAENSAQTIAKLKSEWGDLRPLIDAYLRDASGINASLTALDLAVNQSQSSSIALAKNTNEIASKIKSEAYRQADLLTYLQLFGILAIIIYFIIFIFFVLRQLLRADSEAEEARQETTEIMQTIQEGLFLVDENLQIGQQISDSLQKIFPDQKFTGEKMEEVLAGLLDKKEVENTQRFIKQLFNERIDEHLISGLNPLWRVSVNVEHDGHIEQRYVRFIFTRVWEDEQIKRVLVSVDDITEAVEMEQRLEKERKQNEQQMALLVKVLSIAPQLLASFLRNARHLTERVNAVLRRPEHNIRDLKNKAREIFRDIHSFKGEAAALSLDHFVDCCENIEDRLKDLQERDNITGNDFMSVTIALDELIDSIQSIENLQVNIKQISNNESRDTITDIKHYYSQFAREVAARNDKAVNLNILAYDYKNMDENVHDQVREIIVQLIRNAVVHGIEPMITRQSLEKKPTGELMLSLRAEKDGGFRLNFADDGAGINYSGLRAKLKEQKKYADQPELVDAMSPEELNRFIFLSGVSTAKKSTTDAGRGVGMDVIKDRLRSLGGKVALRSTPKQGTQFVIKIPRN